MMPFDNYEITPCRRFEDDRPGHFYFEPCKPEDADVWTLYGHLPGGGVEAITDCEDEAGVRMLYQRITGQPFGNHDENAATARAMVMAKELLEALEGLAEDSCTLRPMEFRKRLDRANTAIAEATGRSV